jgi:hypothetical protein
MKHLSLSVAVLALSATASAAANVPKAAVDACLSHANLYANVPPGTATFSGSAEAGASWIARAAGSLWRLQVDVPGHIALTCTVSEDGHRLAIEPANS